MRPILNLACQTGNAADIPNRLPLLPFRAIYDKLFIHNPPSHFILTQLEGGT
jgi:hypothetical protein